MHLSTQEFADIIKSFELNEVTGSERDSRRARRMAYRATVDITLADDKGLSAPIPVQLRDLSVRGLSLLFPGELRPGQQFVVGLPRPEGGQVNMLCRVVHARPHRAAAHLVGAEFICTVTSDMLHDAGRIREEERIRQSMLSA